MVNYVAIAIHKPTPTDHCLIPINLFKYHVQYDQPPFSVLPLYHNHHCNDYQNAFKVV
jgi:hypothetical protein